MSKTKYKNQQAIDEFRKKFVNENSLDYAGRASLKVIHPEAVEQFLDEQLEKKEEETLDKVWREGQKSFALVKQEGLSARYTDPTSGWNAGWAMTNEAWAKAIARLRTQTKK